MPRVILASFQHASRQPSDSLPARHDSWLAFSAFCHLLEDFELSLASCRAQAVESRSLIVKKSCRAVELQDLAFLQHQHTIKANDGSKAAKP